MPDAARAGQARVRDLGGLQLVVLPETQIDELLHQGEILQALSHTAAQLAAFGRSLASGVVTPPVGAPNVLDEAWTWLDYLAPGDPQAFI